jgi:hypothetical protein
MTRTGSLQKSAIATYPCARRPSIAEVGSGALRGTRIRSRAFVLSSFAAVSLPVTFLLCAVVSLFLFEAKVEAEREPRRHKPASGASVRCSLALLSHLPIAARTYESQLPRPVKFHFTVAPIFHSSYWPRAPKFDLMVARGGIEPPTRGFSVPAPNCPNYLTVLQKFSRKCPISSRDTRR